MTVFHLNLFLNDYKAQILSQINIYLKSDFSHGQLYVAIGLKSEEVVNLHQKCQKRKKTQIHQKQYCLFRDSSLIRIFVISDFKSDMNVKHR